MTLPARRALISIALLILGGLFLVQAYRMTLDPRDALETELIALGWTPEQYRVRSGGTSHFLLAAEAYGEFTSLRPEQPGRFRICMSRSTPFHGWSLVSLDSVETDL